MPIYPLSILETPPVKTSATYSNFKGGSSLSFWSHALLLTSRCDPLVFCFPMPPINIGRPLIVANTSTFDTAELWKSCSKEKVSGMWPIRPNLLWNDTTITPISPKLTKVHFLTFNLANFWQWWNVELDNKIVNVIKLFTITDTI